MQDPICSSKDLECVERINTETSNCLKPCSGLIVSSLSKTELKHNIDDLLQFTRSYNNYKVVTPNPYYGNNGKSI